MVRHQDQRQTRRDKYGLTQLTRLVWAEAGTISIHFRFLPKKTTHFTFKSELFDQWDYRLKIVENAPKKAKIKAKIFKIFWGPRP